MQDRPNPTQRHSPTQPSQVLPFRPRRRVVHERPLASKSLPQDHETSLSDDLARYEEEDRHIDYRQRMLMNIIAVAIVTLLMCAGVWIADTIADMEKAQDCVMQGRQNCAPIEVVEPNR